MRQLLILDRLQIENANAVAGLTYGFPAITQFLGYVHALSRRLTGISDLVLGGCAVIAHHHQLHAHTTGYWDTVFALTRNPLEKDGKTAPIIEEARMHCTVSLIIECSGAPAGNDSAIKSLCDHLAALSPTLKLAGGRIVGMQPPCIQAHPNAAGDNEREPRTRELLRRLLPGYALVDRTPYLQRHLASLQQQSSPDDTPAEMMDAWLDFAALKYQAVLDNANDSTPAADRHAQWRYQPKPESGYLVPIMIGYHALTQLFTPGEVADVRDSDTPFRFVEAAYSVGEWQSPARVQDIDDILWEYHYDAPYYLCRAKAQCNTHRIDTDVGDDLY